MEGKIEIGKVFDAYHDGKMSPSRLERVVITHVLLRNDMTREERRMWKKALKEDFKNVFDGCIWYVKDNLEVKQFWDWNCRQFIVGHIKNDPETKKEPMLFARTLFGEWYGVNWNFLLDVSGDVRRKNLKTWESCAREMGQTLKWNEEEGVFDYFDKEGNKVK